jgi:hypothetical protein
MKALAMEFYKTRRRKVWLIIAALIIVQLAWMMFGFRDMDAHDLQQAWRFSLYLYPILNSIMMPVIAAVVASRLSDVEHKGQALKLLKTVMPAGRLFDAKFLCGAIYMLATVVVQVLVILIVGQGKGFEGETPIQMLGYYLLFTTAANLTILVLQQALSLLLINQMISLTIGLLGGFAGLFMLYLPSNIAQFIPWGYYGVLMLVDMDWDITSRIVDYYWAPINWTGLTVLFGMFCAIYFIGRTLFVRKEL